MYCMLQLRTWLLDFLITGLLFICIVDTRTFEILLRTYEVREVKVDSSQGHGDGSPMGPPRKRRQTNEANKGDEISSPGVMVRPSAEARGHTGYLTFARLKCV